MERARRARPPAASSKRARYTSHSWLAVPGEPEAVPEGYQRRLTIRERELPDVGALELREGDAPIALSLPDQRLEGQLGLRQLHRAGDDKQQKGTGVEDRGSPNVQGRPGWAPLALPRHG